jgi:hypothetical protein
MFPLNHNVASFGVAVQLQHPGATTVYRIAECPKSFRRSSAVVLVVQHAENIFVFVNVGMVRHVPAPALCHFPVGLLGREACRLFSLLVRIVLCCGNEVIESAAVQERLERTHPKLAVFFVSVCVGVAEAQGKVGNRHGHARVRVGHFHQRVALMLVQ